jgi:hypothetical protein
MLDKIELAVIQFIEGVVLTIQLNVYTALGFLGKVLGISSLKREAERLRYEKCRELLAEMLDANDQYRLKTGQHHPLLLGDSHDSE